MGSRNNTLQGIRKRATMKTPQALINKHALNIFEDIASFEMFLQKIYGKEDQYIRSRGFYPSIDNVAIDGILYTMDEYDNQGKYITLYNKRTGNQITIETEDRYRNGFNDAQVTLTENYGFYRNDITYLD